MLGKAKSSPVEMAIRESFTSISMNHTEIVAAKILRLRPHITATVLVSLTLWTTFIRYEPRKMIIAKVLVVGLRLTEKVTRNIDPSSPIPWNAVSMMKPWIAPWEKTVRGRL